MNTALKRELARLVFRDAARGKIAEPLLDAAFALSGDRLKIDDDGKVHVPAGFSDMIDFVGQIVVANPDFKAGVSAPQSAANKYGLTPAQIAELPPEQKIALANSANKPKGL